MYRRGKNFSQTRRGRRRNLVSSLLIPLQILSSPMRCLEGSTEGEFKMWWLFIQAEHRADSSHQEQREQLEDPCIHPYASATSRAAAAVTGTVTQHGWEHSTSCCSLGSSAAALHPRALLLPGQVGGWFKTLPASAWLSPLLS